MTNFPWFKYYGNTPKTIDYPDCTMYDLVEATASKYPDYTALDFMGKKTSYTELTESVHTAAKALCAIGVKEGESITICMPNTPQAVIMFYAANLCGATASIIHPLSSEGEIEFYIKTAESSTLLTLDQFYPKIAKVCDKVSVKNLIITSVSDELPALMKIGYALTEGRKIPPVPERPEIIKWNDFLKKGYEYNGEYIVKKKGSDPAAILYSGGTTGTTKGIFLSNLNFNALAIQTKEMGDCVKPGDAMLAVLPIFHGFGLGVCIHTMLIYGCASILVPRFNAESYAKLIKKKKPNFIAGVPTLFEAILRNPDIDNIDLSCLRGVFSGGDSLSVDLKRRFDDFLFSHGSPVPVREGYGATECVAASCLTPVSEAREGSIGVPFPDTVYKICDIETSEELPYGAEGEICISGPTVMLGYVKRPDETADTLRVHSDGKTYLHTGDLGVMDSDGFIYFKQRIKRMIITSGYNVYPSQLESIINSHPAVSASCVIGVPDPYKMQKVKAFIVLKEGYEFTPELKKELFAHCRKNIARYAMPYDIEAREQLPKTLVGKIAYKVLEQEELEKYTSEVEGEAPAVMT
ncbi:MAG: AMP-binding protein [Clostridia bacterium]|nr:AMP-binding protein [Clostridia bacterium]